MSVVLEVEGPRVSVVGVIVANFLELGGGRYFLVIIFPGDCLLFRCIFSKITDPVKSDMYMPMMTNTYQS